MSVLGLGNWVTSAKMEEKDAFDIYVAAFRAGIVPFVLNSLHEIALLLLSTIPLLRPYPPLFPSFSFFFISRLLYLDVLSVL